MRAYSLMLRTPNARTNESVQSCVEPWLRVLTACACLPAGQAGLLIKYLIMLSGVLLH